MLVGSDGVPVQDWSRAKEIDPGIRDFRFIQHDMMFGKQHGSDKFFPEVEALHKPTG